MEFYLLNEKTAILLLAFIGGFIDAAGYLKLQGVFTSSITGNIVVASASVISLRGVICRSSVCIAFFLGGGFTAAFAQKMKYVYQLSPSNLSISLFSIELAFFIIFWALGINFSDQLNYANDFKLIDDWHVVLIGSIMGASMGVHNIAAKETIPNCPPTTVMTSTLINVAGNAANSISYYLTSVGLYNLFPSDLSIEQRDRKPFKKKFQDSFTKFSVTVGPLIFFIIGAIIGAVAMFHGDFWSISIPSVGILFLCLDILLASKNPSLPISTASSPPSTLGPPVQTLSDPEVELCQFDPSSDLDLDNEEDMGMNREGKIETEPTSFPSSQDQPILTSDQDKNV